MNNPQRDWLKDLAESEQLGPLQRRALAQCLAERDAAWAICERLVKWEREHRADRDNKVISCGVLFVAWDARDLLEGNA